MPDVRSQACALQPVQRSGAEPSNSESLSARQRQVLECRHSAAATRKLQMRFTSVGPRCHPYSPHLRKVSGACPRTRGAKYVQSLGRSGIRRLGLDPSGLEGLPPRPLEALELLAHGHRCEEIANSLQTSMATVHIHGDRIYEKLHVHSRSQAVAVYAKSARGDELWRRTAGVDWLVFHCRANDSPSI